MKRGHAGALIGLLAFSAAAQTNTNKPPDLVIEKAKKERAEFIQQYHPLRVIDGKLYDFSEYFTSKWISGPGYSKYEVQGKVAQVLDDGLLIADSQRDRMIYLKNYRYQEDAVDGMKIKALAIPIGRKQYVTTQGTKATVALHDCGRYYDPKTDKFEQKLLIASINPETEVPVWEIDKQ
jgi:hypothetical protein